MPTTCFTCEKSFSKEESLQCHLTAKKHSRAYHCQQCDDFIFPTQAAVNEHARRDHRNYSCAYCNSKFCSDDGLAAHNKAKHEHKCKVSTCSKNFPTEEKLKCHTSQSHQHPCHQCGEFFDSTQQFAKHISAPEHEHHIRTYARANLKCCGQTFRDRLAVNDHFTSRHSSLRSQGAAPTTYSSVVKSTIKHPVDTAAALPVNNIPEQIKKHLGGSDLGSSNVFGVLAEISPNQRDKIPSKATESAKPSESFVSRALRSASASVESTFGLTTKLSKDITEHVDVTPDLIKPPTESIRCRICPERSPVYLPSESALDEHQWDVHTAWRLAREDRRTDSMLEALRLSVAVEHWDVGTQTQSPSEPESSVIEACVEAAIRSLAICDICTEKFDTTALLQTHKDVHHTIKCDECFGTTFDNATAFKKHLTEVHIPPCTRCGERFFYGLFSPTHNGQCQKCELKIGSSLADLLGLGDGSDLKTGGCAIDLLGLRVCSELKTEGSVKDLLGLGVGFEMDSVISEPPSSADAPQLHPTATHSSCLSIDSKKPEQNPPHNYVSSGMQTAKYNCAQCNYYFATQEDFDYHCSVSAFHLPRTNACIECAIMFPNQIALLQHIESKPHRTRWILTMA